jgi:predicted GTPase
MVKTEINIIILGQTGVGKSTLINYLYGSDIVETGTGSPKTKKGEFKKVSIPSPKNADVVVNVFDSWGLESNKAKEWEAVIEERLSDSFAYSDMIYAVIYCISFSNDRIHDFEIAAIKKLLDKQYRVIIVFTNGDNSRYWIKRISFRSKLKKDMVDYKRQYIAVDVCSKVKIKIGQSGPLGSTFGREELFKKIEQNASINFIFVLMEKLEGWRSKSLNRLDLWKQDQVKEIPEFFRLGLKTKPAQAKEYHDKMISELELLIKDIFDKIRNEINMVNKLEEKMKGEYFNEENINKITTANFWKKWVPVVGWIKIFDSSERDLLEKELKKVLNDAVNLAINEINDTYNYTYNREKNMALELDPLLRNHLWKCSTCGTRFLKKLSIKTPWDKCYRCESHQIRQEFL